MEEIKNFINDYLKKETETSEKLIKPDINNYNKTLEELHSMVIGEMFNRLGFISLSKPKDQNFYDRYKDFKPVNPRHLFKISQYKHVDYLDVWVAYTSGANPKERVKLLTHALFIIKEEGKFKIARNYIYSDKGGMSEELGWEGFSGYQDLTFESLGELIEVERYLKPLEFDNGLELYNQEA